VYAETDTTLTTQLTTYNMAEAVIPPPNSNVHGMIPDFKVNIPDADLGVIWYHRTSDTRIWLATKEGGKGDQGKSAYQVWLDAGNTGTEADYLASLKGADGSNVLPTDDAIEQRIKDPASKTAVALSATIADGVTAGIAPLEADVAALPAQVEAQVPPLVAEAIAADGTPALAARDAVQNAMAGLNLAEITETYDATGPAFTLLDANDNATSIELDGEGKPTKRFAEDIGTAGDFLKGQEAYEPGFAFADETGQVIPDLTFNRDGTFDQTVVERLRPRLDMFNPARIARQIRALPAATETKLVTASNNANKYMLKTWLPARFPGTTPITTLGGTDEVAVRHPAAAAFSVAAALYTGTFNATTTGVTEVAAKAEAIRVIKGVALNHMATTPGGWGNYWQSGSWAQMVGAAAWMLWADLDTDTRTYVTAMADTEGDRIAASTPDYYWMRYDGVEMFPGDSKAEELAWDGGALSLFAQLLPTNPGAATWRSEASTHLIAAGTMPNDILGDRTVQGVHVGSTFDGWNVNQNGTITNHGIIHPDYMCSMAELAWSAGVLLAHNGERIPDSYVMNAERIYRALSEVSFNGRAIYTPDSWVLNYPEGTDWGAGRMADKAMTDVVAHCLGLDSECNTPAAVWADLHLQRCLDMQARFADGHTYRDASEDNYSGAEPWVARNLALALLAAKTPTTTRYTYATIGA